VIPVVARNAEAIDVNIDKAINHPAPIPYFQAANFYFESDKKIDVAKSYVDKAVEQDPKAYYMWNLKARIEKKLGNDDAAVIAAKKAIELSKGTANENEYFHNNTKLIEDIKRRHHKQTID
jgi:Tfp pilus assembly protein PilF